MEKARDDGIDFRTRSRPLKVDKDDDDDDTMRDSGCRHGCDDDIRRCKIVCIIVIILIS